jgi:arylsulfatase A-like enzyme
MVTDSFDDPDGAGSRGRAVRRGVACTVTAWTAYAVVEIWVAALIPWLRQPATLHAPTHWGTSVLFLGVCVISALALGAAIGLFAWRQARILRRLGGISLAEAISAASLATVGLAFAANLYSFNPWSKELVALSLPGLVVVVAAVFDAVPGPPRGRLGAVANPWTMAVATAGVVGVVGKLESVIAGTAWSLGLLGALLLASYALHGRLPHRGQPRPKRGDSVLVTATRRIGPATAALVVVTLVVCWWSNRAPALARPGALRPLPASPTRNVLLITLDTVRADHMSLYGYERETTPNLARFAANATLYEQAYAPAAMTLSSHASLFTGLLPRRHGAHFTDDDAGRLVPLADQHETLAELLATDHRTIAVVANTGPLLPRLGLDQGFQHYEVRASVDFLKPGSRHYLSETVARAARPLLLRRPSLRHSRADAITGRALDILDELATTEEPFLLFLNYMDAHRPYLPPPPYDTRFPGRDPNYQPRHYDPIKRGVLSLERSVASRVRDHLVSQYDGGIAFLDDQLGRVFERLEESGLAEETLVIVASDHGEAFGERSLMEHGVSVYQDQVHVPLVIRYPGRAPARVATPVSLIDILPTVLDAAGYPAKDEIDGLSLLAADAGNPRPLLSECYPDGYYRRLHTRFHGVARGLVWGSLKLVSPSQGEGEFYDLAEDPREANDLAKTRPRLAAELSTRLDALIEGTELSDVMAEELDESTRERLRELGYLQ